MEALDITTEVVCNARNLLDKGCATSPTLGRTASFSLGSLSFATSIDLCVLLLEDLEPVSQLLSNLQRSCGPQLSRAEIGGELRQSHPPSNGDVEGTVLKL